MLSETQMGALRVLEALEDEETAYTVNISNPVCPCCGAKLVINDDIEPGQNEELNTENLEALEKGLPNLLQHVDNIKNVCFDKRAVRSCRP